MSKKARLVSRAQRRLDRPKFPKASSVVFHWRADKGGCGHDRMIYPSHAINRTVPGWAAEHDVILRGEDLASGRFDLIVGQRICSEEAWPAWSQFINPALEVATAMELDDLLFDIDPSNKVAYDYFMTPETQERLAQCIHLADALIVSCEPLADTLRHVNPNVYVIPNYLPAELLDRLPHKWSGPVRVGWAGGSSHFEDIKLAAQGVTKAMRPLPDSTLSIIGQNFLGFFEHLGDRATWTPWRENKNLYVKALDLDIGLCPLRGTNFDIHKTAVKALEYSFRGIPTIASNVTPYREFVEDGVTGILVDGDDEWSDAIVELACNHVLRNRMGDNAFEKAQDWTAEAHAQERVDIYQEIIDRRLEVRTPKWEALQAALVAARAAQNVSVPAPTAAPLVTV